MSTKKEDTREFPRWAKLTLEGVSVFCTYYLIGYGLRASQTLRVVRVAGKSANKEGE